MPTLRILPYSIRLASFAAIFLAMVLAAQVTTQAQQPNWIWTPRADANHDQPSECYFRKKFTLVRPEACQLIIAAGDRYQLYINGRIASEGASYGSPTELDVSSLLQPGVNLIAAKVEHVDGEQVGLAIKFRVKEKGETRWRSLVTDASWKSRIREIEAWNNSSLNDLGWLASQELQTATLNQKNTAIATQNASSKSSQVSAEKVNAQTANAQTADATKAENSTEDLSNRFQVSKEFVVQQVMLDEETDSLIAMTFNEFGKLLLSREGGPLLIADLTKPVKDPGRLRVLSDKVTNCQGILALNGDVYVTGQGPDGMGLYHLTDANKDGVFEPTQTLLKFQGDAGEHGPHGIILGNDGMIYVNIGNGSQIGEQPSPSSPYRHAYEGTLQTRYDDGAINDNHAAVPGGTIVRLSLDGSKIETVAGGIRNSYDLVFNTYGDLFIHDSDLESDMGMSWYRPTKVFFVPDGAEMGWRGGWSKYPDYYADQTPSVCDTGRGSPTGATIYQHLQFPARYHDTIFFADWSEGRILTLKTQPEGAGYVGQVEEFMSGRPLNVVDLTVGEDGALYFCTGGRGTAGGVYRVVWNGTVPEKMLKFETDLEKIIRHPQPNAAWARQNIARLKQNMGDEKWNQSIVGVANEKRNTVKYRLMAMDKMVLYGPFPTIESIKAYATDENAEIRAKAAQLCGLKRTPYQLELLEQLITDKNARVRRIALESYMRLGETPPQSSLFSMVASPDRFESLGARRMLERMPMDQWSDQVLATADIKLFMNGSLAIVTADPSLENSYKVLARCSQFMEGFVSDEDFVSLLRVVQLALAQGKVDGAKIPAFANRIGNEFPSGNGLINRELSRIMAYLQIGSLDDRIVDYFETSADSPEDKLHVAVYLQRIGGQLSGEERLALIDYLEKSHDRISGAGSKSYLSRAIREIADSLTTDQLKTVLENGEIWPDAVVSAFYKMPQELDADLLELVISVDQRIAENPNERSDQVRLGTIAILAQSGSPEAMDYLRQMWQNEPARRGDIAIGLAQQPQGENWAYLISSLPVLDDLTGNEVLEKLTSVNRRPRDPGHYRAVIELGYRLRAEGIRNVSSLMEHWTGQSVDSTSSEWTRVLADWKTWFEREFPNEPKIHPQDHVKQGDYSTDQVLSYLESNGYGDASHGRMLFSKAQCALCHRMGTDGTSAGPDLTSIARRFSTRELVDAIIHPSNFVPAQYRSMTILTTDGDTFTGMATKNSDGSWVILQQDGMPIRLSSENIEEIKESEVSAMPARLLDGLSMSEIADLIAYLGSNSPSQSKAETDSDIR